MIVNKYFYYEAFHHYCTLIVITLKTNYTPFSFILFQYLKDRGHNNKMLKSRSIEMVTQPKQHYADLVSIYLNYHSSCVFSNLFSLLRLEMFLQHCRFDVNARYYIQKYMIIVFTFSMKNYTEFNVCFLYDCFVLSLVKS